MGVEVRTLTGGGSASAVPVASSDGVTGCGPLQATTTVTATANVGIIAQIVARAIFILSGLGKRF